MNKEQIKKLKAIAIEIRSDENKIYYVLFQTSTEGEARVQYLAECKERQNYYLWYEYSKNFYKNTIPYTPKPEPVKMPLTYEDMKQRAIDRKPMWIVALPEFLESFSIRHFDSTDVVINTEGGKHNYTYEQLMELNSIFIDGDPCYKLSEPGRSEK